MPGDGPKTVYEIAMERLRRKDVEAGVEHVPLTDAQRAAIAEVRNAFEAKLAQEEVMHASEIARTFEPQARATMEAGYRRTRERLNSEREAKIEKIRRGDG